jgi:hypothetical protein
MRNSILVILTIQKHAYFTIIPYLKSGYQYVIGNNSTVYKFLKILFAKLDPYMRVVISTSISILITKLSENSIILIFVSTLTKLLYYFRGIEQRISFSFICSR